jgi:cytochrome b561
MLRNMPDRYGFVSKLLHWTMAVMIIALVVVGLYMTGLEKEDPSRVNIYAMHKSMGTLALFLLIARVAWLRITPAPALPRTFSDMEKRIMNGTRSLLYLFMALLPITGYTLSVAGGHPVSFFGLLDLPTLFEKNKALAGLAHETHELLAYAILALVVLHIAGAVKHRLLNAGGEADVLQRML